MEQTPIQKLDPERLKHERHDVQLDDGEERPPKVEQEGHEQPPPSVVPPVR